MIDTYRRQTVAITRSDTADPAIPLPAYETAQSAGMDVCANLAEANREEGITLLPGQRVLVPTGFSIAIPDGFEMQVRPRSGLALRHGVSLVNAPGTIDADYRGEVGIILINHGSAIYTVSHGERIAQLVLAPVVRANWKEVARLNETTRGEGGFGSTGR